MTQPTLVILAAGMGSRYGGLKQLDPVGPNGEIVLDFSIFDALRAGFGKVVFVIRRDIEEAFREHIGQRVAEKIQVDYVFQEMDACLPTGIDVNSDRKKPWGTGHAVLVCKDVVNEPFCVINADDFYGAEGFQVMADFLADSTPNECSMVAYRMRNTLSPNGTVSRGICEVADGRLVTVTEHTKIVEENGSISSLEAEGGPTKLTGDEPVSLNFWGFTPQIFVELEKQFNTFISNNSDQVKAEFYIPAAVDECVQSGAMSVKVLHSSDHWFGVTYPEDKASVVEGIRKLIEDGVYPSSL
jgi:dTDP-glucose pyrophosphorylase